jgi:hypothetical protein
MMGVVEKYVRATRSSHLEMKVEPGDLDVLIAAGMVADGIGTDLIRLRCERDAISRLPGARLAFPMLKSMARTRARLLKYASEESGYSEASVELQAVIGKVLDLFLDPNCVPCGGTGKTGSYGAAMPMCQACRGSTKREAIWPNSELEHLAGWLQSQMESKIDSALRKMHKLLRT